MTTREDGAPRRAAVEPDGAAAEPMLASARLTTTLEQFARAAGLAISVYSINGELAAGPFATTPLTRRLVAADGWCSEKTPCRSAEVRVVRDALDRGAVTFAEALGAMVLFAAPIRADGRAVGAIAGGWVFDTFPDPVACDRVARLVGASFPEFWDVARQQAPVSREKLAIYGDLLQAVSDALLAELRETRREQAAGRVLKLLNESALDLTRAASVREVGRAAAEAALALTGAARARLLIREGEEWAVAAERGSGPPPTRSTGITRHIRGTVTVPIESADGELLASLEAEWPGPPDRDGHEPELSALAGQVAVALQKAALIADLEREREALHGLNRVKDEFLATVSHELRTPLNAMLGWAQMLKSGVLEEATRTQAIDAIERNAQVQAQLIGDLLDLSRIISGKLRLAIGDADVQRAVLAAVDAVRPAADAKGIAIVTRFPSAPALIRGDANRLEQIFWNLLSNSVKFTPSAGRIEVTIEEMDQFLRVQVKDTGRGISAEFLPYVFDRFSQADDSMMRVHGGLGLGLGIVRHLAEMHGGNVRAESEGEGKGTTMTVTLPIGVPLRRPAAPAQPEEPERELSLAGAQVLVVDDERDSLEVAVMALETAGADVRAASSAAEALDLLAVWTPNLLVADLAMPEEDGYSLIRKIRAREREQGGQIAALALTAHAREKDRVAALEAGFDEHLAKPTEPLKLIGEADRMLRRRGSDGR